jgi:hypothetical protein
MKRGRGKAKGSAFERSVCVELSLWVTDGKDKDAFWRSSMSGGRATVHVKKGGKNRQAGDITAVAPEGHELMQEFFVECKHVKNLDLDSFMFKKTGALWKFWKQAKKQAADHGKRPLIIARQNMFPTIVVSDVDLIIPGSWKSRKLGVRVGLFDALMRTNYAIMRGYFRSAQ